jgi:tyrosyl-tRNA synthetase
LKKLRTFGEARRLMEGRGLRLDGAFVDDPKATVTLTKPVAMQKGRNTFVRVLLDEGPGGS